MKHSITNRLNYKDYLLLIIIFICPYLDAGLWWTITSFSPSLSTMGTSLLCFVLALIIAASSLGKRYKTITPAFFFLVSLAVVYTVLIFVISTAKFGFWNSLTIYRVRFIQLPTFFLIMGSIANLSIQKIHKYFQLMLKLLVIMSILYVAQCAGINIFGSEIRTENAGGISMIRNVIGMPPIIPVLFAYCFCRYIYDKNKVTLTYMLICLCVCMVSFTRNIMASAIIIIIISIFLHTIKYGLSGKIKILFSGLILFAIVTLIFPSIINYWTNLIDSTINSQLVNKEGTYAFRQNLIQNAYQTLCENNKIWTGLGYIRDTPKGEYSLVLGTDTYIAPVLWCEGILGLILRCLPIAYLLFNSLLIFFRTKDRNISLCALVIIASIVSAIPNYVQTPIFMKYNMYISLLYMLYILSIKTRKAC